MVGKSSMPSQLSMRWRTHKNRSWVFLVAKKAARNNNPT